MMMHKSSALRPAWTPLTIFLMILGFIVFWPLGLAMLAYILWGDRFHQMYDDAAAQFRGSRWMDDRPIFSGVPPVRRSSAVGEVAFEAYRESEIRRIEDERARLDVLRAEYDDYLRDLHRARDREELERFMAVPRDAAPETARSTAADRARHDGWSGREERKEDASAASRAPRTARAPEEAAPHPRKPRRVMPFLFNTYRPT